MKFYKKVFVLFLSFVLSAITSCGVISQRIYTFIYHTNSVDTFESITIEESKLEEYELPVPTKEGHSFASWCFDEELLIEFDKSKLIEQAPAGGDVDLYAKYSVNSYMLSIHYSEKVDNYEYLYGQTLELPDNSELGYHTVYYLDSELKSVFENKTMPASNIDLYPQVEIDYLKLPVVLINTNNNEPIVSKEEYINCNVSIANCADEHLLKEEPAGIKGRGNTTWTRENKKPYKIKFNTKQNLLGLGNGKTKKWVLLANADDCSLMRNLLALKLARQMSGINWNPNCQSVDLYLNGEYRGVYILAEQVEENKNRVNLKNNDFDNSVDIDFLVELSQYSVSGTTEYLEVNTKKYEIKNDLSKNEEICQSQKENIKTFLEDCWYRIINSNQSSIEEIIDINSAVDSYLVEEILKNLDMGYDSFYLHKNNVKLVFGPLWDFDLSLGNGDETCQYPEGLYCAIYREGDNGNKELSNYWFYGLMTHNWFREKVITRWNEIYSWISNFFKNEIDSEMPNRDNYLRNFDKWTDSFGVKHDRETELILSIDNFDDHITYLREWINKRIAWLNNCYNSESFINGEFIVYDGLIAK